MSAICSRFTQNAWKKDLCSNCFKSKDEHKVPAVAIGTLQKTENKRTAEGAGGIMKGSRAKTKNCKVRFPKDLTQVIGYGGEWSESEGSEDETTPLNGTDELTSTDDEDHEELTRLTKVNTDFNTNNGNLLGDPEDNIKKSFAALRLGTPQLDAEGKKQTLKINVTPFGVSTKIYSNKKSKYENKKEDHKVIKRKEELAAKKDVPRNDGNNSPPIERAMEKSLLEEISETLEKKQNEVKKTQCENDKKIKFEITSLSGPMPKITTELKKTIARNAPITKDHFKPKVNVFQKYSDTDSNTSDNENGVSAYYDVVETTNGYENIPDGHAQGKDHPNGGGKLKPAEDRTIFSSSQYLTDMLLSTKTHAATYSLHEGSFITSKITSDGLIVTKCSSDDALDSTGSSFDGSSDEEASYSMNRSESDSGIGISIGTEYKSSTEKMEKDKKTNLSNNSSDYEDIQIVEETLKEPKQNKIFPVEKSRELAGEPDGSADPDGNLEAPALPKSPPPLNAEARSSFLHGLQKSLTSKKPEIPAKPTAEIIKSLTKRQPGAVEQQVICQLQQVIKAPENTSEKLTLTRKEGCDYSKILKKGRAPNPPSPSNSDESANSSPNLNKSFPDNSCESGQRLQSSACDVEQSPNPKSPETPSNIYTRNLTVGIKSTSPVIREKDKRERATVNPKFRSLNTFSTNKRAQIPKTSSPDSARKNLSVSEECLLEEKKKKKFSIKKFLRMGTSKTTDNLHRKEGIYSEIATGDDSGVSGKPRLVIIHPIDINPTAVEVVKEINRSSNDTMPVVIGKPPAPPQRTCSDGNRLYELNKPARPLPPKSAELRRKQKLGFNVNTTGSVKSKADNVYANLGEIRSSIAPRKPERTASMREREAQLELAKKQRQGNENSDTISVCSSNGDRVPIEVSLRALNNTSVKENQSFRSGAAEIASKSEQNGSDLGLQREGGEHKTAVSKLETFERPSSDVKSKQILSDGLKNSVLKINNTIDSYLKDKREYETMYDASKASPSMPRNSAGSDSSRRNCDSTAPRYQARTSLQDAVSISGASYTRSECGPRYGFNSLANIPRVVSASYCGSEMGESDIYSPYSFYGSETGGGEVANDINEGFWGTPTTSSKSRVKTTNRLRMRKGRSVVHKSIEDNYSAVVVANHEALAQVLDQLQQTPIVSPTLRPLANAINLRFEDFVIMEGVQAFVVGKRAFHAAMWSTAPVTLALSADCNQISGVGGEMNQLSGGVSGVLNPITEFCDLVPNYHLPLMPSTEVRMLQATISVLPRMQLDTLHSIGSVLKSKSQLLDKHANFRGSIPNLAGQKEQANLRNVCSVQNLTTLNEESAELGEDIQSMPGMPSFDDVMCREVGFIMLQLVNGLKNLQAKAIEEMPLTLSNVVLCKEAENKDAQARLCVLQGANSDEDEPTGRLCRCAYVALTEMLPKTKLTPILSEILLQERSDSLSKAKSVLEFVLWGPSDVVLTGSTKERELALQRWLDLERATVLHGLVRTRVELTIYDECHLMFLVRSSAKVMNEAAKIVSDFKLTHII